MREHDVVIVSEVDVAGTLCLPEDASASAPVPACLLIAGTGADRRDGDLDLPRPRGDEPPAPGTMRRIAHHLAHHGVASLRWDRRGFGASGGDPDQVDYDTDLADAVACLGWLRAHAEVDGARVAVAGHSAGALVACLVCRDVAGVAAAALLGALSTPIEDMLRRNLGRVRRHWQELSAEQRSWLERESPAQLVRAEGVEALLKAARHGRETVRLEGHGVVLDVRTARLRQDLATDYAAELRHVSSPALVLHGGDDLNVGVENALVTYRALRDAGNARVELAVLPGLEHYFNPVSPDPGRRVWERLSLEALRRPMARRALDVIAGWAVRVLG
jgi:pimeloyl-ACP methyl ester carboxylesterase